MKYLLKTRFRPPFNLFAGSLYFCWLFGSISYDLITAESIDITLLILFGILFLLSLHLMIRSLRSLVLFNGTGLKITGKEIIYSEPGWLSVSTIQINRSDISEIEVSNESVLIRHKKDDLILRLNNFLLGPESIIHALRIGRGELPDREKASIGPVKFEGIKCSSCGAGFRIDLSESEKLTCDYCNNSDSIPDRMIESLKQLKEILLTIPENLRQLGKKSEGKLIVTGGKSIKGMRTAAYITLGVWVLFSSVEFISSILREGTQINYKFIVITISLGVFTFISTILLSAVLKRIIRRLSFRYSADPIPGGKASCRLCGTELTGTGLLRRCSFCGTDNIIDQDVLIEEREEAVISFETIRDRVLRTVSDTERIISISSDQLLLLTATQFFWLHIPVLVLLDGSAGMIMRLTPLFVLFTIGAFLLLIKGIREIKVMNSFESNRK